METITPNQIVPFLKRFRFQGGSVRVIHLRNQSPQMATGTIIVSATDLQTNERVRLKLYLEGVEEFRFQRRPGPGLVRLKDMRIGWFNGLMYLNLDPYAVDGPPGVHDFRASDAFIAGRSLKWELVPPKSKSAGPTGTTPSCN